MTDTFETSNPQPFDSLGLFTYLRTYARRHDENDPNSTVESWKECITRIVNATNSQLNVGFSKDEKQELFDLLYNLKCSVAGRFLWQLGTRTVDNLGLMSLQNCAFTVCDEPVKPFVWVMNFLMLGAGCGYRISQEDVAKFPRIQSAVITRKDTKDADFIVPDTRQGWVKLLGKVMKSHFYSGAGFSYSCSLLRSKGAPIKSFGGLSSGPEVLCEGIAKINEILNKYAGTKITSVICLDIMNIIGKIVVSGNVRRCLPKGSLVLTDKGRVPIEDIKVGNYVKTMSGYHMVTNFFDQGLQKLTQISTQDGDFFCTGNHQMAVYDINQPNYILYQKYIWKQAKDLDPDTDQLVYRCDVEWQVRPSKVRKISETQNFEYTYDIEVEDVHEFFCNGYLTHNSAQIALGDATDKEYLQAKRWDLGNVPNWRCYSNNSVICNDINEIIENDDFWQGYNGNGEPYGLINLKLSRSCGRLGETQYPDPTVQGYNPCVAGDTIIFTEFGPKKVTEILNQKLRVYVDGELYPTTCGFFSTGVQQLYKLTTKEGFTLRATANHLIMTPSGKWVTVSSLRQGDEVKLHEHTIPNYYEDDDNAYEVENVQLCILRKGQVYVENKNGLLEQRRGENNPFYATVASVTPDSIEEVFDCTVPDIHAFDANGFYVHNCAEQSLADKETCCLAEVYLPNISSFEELKKCVSYLYRVCKHSLTLPCADSRETQEIVHRNMRMGIGMTGVLQASEEQREWLKPCYEFLRTFDRIYSQFESFPTSVKLTTCKPSGTLSILGRCTSGIHPGFAQYYIRRIRVAAESKLINLAKEHGYHVEYVQNFDGSNDYTTHVISFPYSLPEGTVLAENSTAVQQMEYVKWLQTVWSDNSVSVTVYYRKEELPEIKEWLWKNYNDSVKTISFLLHSEHGFKQAPLEKITKEQYDEMVRTTRPILNAEGICYSAGDEKFVGEGECAGGACPLK
jgi:ribonucleotide reductase alpha subunit